MLGADQGLGGISMGIHRGRMDAAFCSAEARFEPCSVVQQQPAADISSLYIISECSKKPEFETACHV